jgi:hypothetical protein
MLVELVSVPDWPAVGTRDQFDQNIAWVERMRKRYPQTYAHCSEVDVVVLRELLRKAWTSKSRRETEWLVFLMRYLHAGNLRRLEAVAKDKGQKLVREWQGKMAVLEIALARPERAAGALCAFLNQEQALAALASAGPLLVSELERALAYLQRNLSRARKCRNKDCERYPFFFGKRQNQRYCSNECKSEALRAIKRRWWHVNRGKKKRRRK